MEENGRLLDTVKDHLEHGRDERLGQLLADAHPADVSNLLRELPVPLGSRYGLCPPCEPP